MGAVDYSLVSKRTSSSAASFPQVRVLKLAKAAIVAKYAPASPVEAVLSKARKKKRSRKLIIEKD